ncbi:MAG: hypothetical protein GC192_24620 [Bacteroidetes bacterium]|nr:hypothetical protein [Bacteroidota bacterium]
MLNQQLKQHLIKLLAPYRPERVGVFGSYARGENQQGSDLDILIKFKEAIGLLELVQIEQELSDKLGIKVDLVTEGSLKHPMLKQYVQKDLIEILG